MRQFISIAINCLVYNNDLYVARLRVTIDSMLIRTEKQLEAVGERLDRRFFNIAERIAY